MSSSSGDPRYPGFIYDQDRQEYVKEGEDGVWYSVEDWRLHYAARAKPGYVWSFRNQHYERLLRADEPIIPDPEPEPTPEPNSDDDDEMPKAIGNIPPTFNGDTHLAQSWLLQVEAYLEINEEVYIRDDQKVVFVLSLMTKGQAAKWAEGHLKTRHPYRQGGETIDSRFRRYVDLIETIKLVFYPKNAAETAIKRISSLKQTGSIAAYASLFQTIVADTGITEQATLMMFFRNGLKREIAQAVLQFQTLPVNVNEWLDRALDVETRKNMLGGGPGYVGKKDPYAMDIDKLDADEAKTSTSVRKTYLSPQEREKRKKQGLCFKCGKKGLIKDCPNHPSITASVRKTTAKKDDEDDPEMEEFYAAWKAHKARKLKAAEKKKEEEDF